MGGAVTYDEYPLTGTMDWTLVKTTITVPGGTGYLRILAFLAAPDCIGGKVWFDDIRMVKK